MKTLGIDCRFASHHAGLGRYTRELVSSLLSIAPADLQIVLFVRNRQEGWLATLPPGRARIVTANFAHYSWGEQVWFPRIITQSGASLFFSPHFNVPFFCPLPFVVTVHDLILHHFPNQASLLKQMAYRVLLARAVRKAKKIIAVSTFTAQELGKFFGEGVLPKVQVITEGVSPLFHPRTAEESASVLALFGIEKPFFLYVGNAKEHKNLPLLLHAFERLNDPQASLVLVTSGVELERLKPLPAHVYVLESVIDHDLALLYSMAKAFVTPSLYEGFCLPIAEAEACGCPVIAVRATAIPETASPHARLVEPTTTAFVEAMRTPPSPLSPPPPKHWEDTARATLTLLLSIRSWTR